MKHDDYFSEFLRDEVNLNQTRLDKLDGHVEAVTNYLKDHLASYQRIERQGSYALGTIIKPVSEFKEYDADLLLYMEYDPRKEPQEYIDEVYECFRLNANYRDKVHRKTRCVFLDYAGDVHLDIVPCIQGPTGVQFICNNKTNKFEVTDGTGYREWFNELSRVTNGHLKRVTRLLKYMRDHKGNFAVKSILLTTLIGSMVWDSRDKEEFSSVPNALKIVSNRLNDFLQANPTMPRVYNPALPSEDFMRHWTQGNYNNFREKFGIYTGRINDAFSESDHDASVEKWRKLFGDDFGKKNGGGGSSDGGGGRGGSGGSSGGGGRLSSAGPAAVVTAVTPRKPWAPR